MFLAANLEVGLSSKSPVLDVADLVLGKIEVSEIGEAKHGGKEHCLEFVLIQPQVMNLRDTRGQRVFRRCVATSGYDRGGAKKHTVPPNSEVCGLINNYYTISQSFVVNHNMLSSS